MSQYLNYTVEAEMVSNGIQLKMKLTKALMKSGSEIIDFGTQELMANNDFPNAAKSQLKQLLRG